MVVHVKTALKAHNCQNSLHVNISKLYKLEAVGLSLSNYALKLHFLEYVKLGAISSKVDILSISD